MVTKPCPTCERLMDAEHGFCTVLCKIANSRAAKAPGGLSPIQEVKIILKHSGLLRGNIPYDGWLGIQIWSEGLGPILRCQSCKGDFHAKTMGHRFCSKICKRADYEVRKGREPSQRTARRRLLQREAERHGNYHEKV